MKIEEAIERDNGLVDAGMPASERLTCFLHHCFREDCLDEHRPGLGPVLLYRLKEETYA